MSDAVLDELAINTIRGLCIDMVERANSGHPGTPLDIAPVAYTLWQSFLRFDPADPTWANRDRFVLSEGHASALLWSLLYVTKTRRVDSNDELSSDAAVTLEDLMSFRQLGSHCPGHPEYRVTSGVEATTGPLGQGIAMSVGMALAQRWLAEHFNREGFTLFDYDVYALAGDGCLMEGVGAEAASLAGHQKLSKLCWIYDSNRVTIEGHTDITFSEDVAQRFVAYGWNVVTVPDANDLSSIRRALTDFRAEVERPTLIIVHSHIGYGSPVEDTPRAHGEPLGSDGVRSTKRFFDLPVDQEFAVSSPVYEHFASGVGARGALARGEWTASLSRYQSAYPALADELARLERRDLPEDWDEGLPTFAPDATGLATRASSGQVLNSVATKVPWMVGGAADLDPSTLTRMTFDGAGDAQGATPGGRNFHFGVREHAAAAVASGLTLSKLRTYWSTFLIFSDYARAAIRLSALMEIPVVHVFTHDSIGVGQDGPTHQPVEQLASLRAMPGLLVFRPADANEVVETWRIVAALTNEPAALALTRQTVPTLDRSVVAPADLVRFGAYVLVDDPACEPDVILLATGSEVHLALGAREQLVAEGVAVRVVSMPCWELFERQSPQYRESVLPRRVRARVAIEQASTFGWDRYVGEHGAVVGMTTFGASAPLSALQSKFGFTVSNVLDVARATIERSKESW